MHACTRQHCSSSFLCFVAHSCLHADRCLLLLLVLLRAAVGPGTQSRSASCFRSDSSIADDSQCGTSVVSQACSLGNCVGWRENGWGSCGGATCGTGTQTQTVTCWDSTADKAFAGACPGTKPPTTRSCALPACYAWSIGPWTACGASCGVATQTRAVTCRNSATQAEVAASYCGAQPATIQTCTLPHCYEWQFGLWTACNQACGWGTLQRDVWCQDLTADERQADGSQCLKYVGPGSMPPVAENCKVANCYVWSMPDWPSIPCSETCGPTTPKAGGAQRSTPEQIPTASQPAHATRTFPPGLLGCFFSRCFLPLDLV